MVDEQAVFHALLRAKGLSVAELAAALRVTRQHAHRLLTGARNAGPRRVELDRVLALGTPSADRPIHAVAELGAEDGLELVPAGDVQPVFGSPDLATEVALPLTRPHPAVCVVPVWPSYAWSYLVAFHAAWGSHAEPRSVFLVDEAEGDLPLESILDELRTGMATTLELRAQGRDPALVREVEAKLERLH